MNAQLFHWVRTCLWLAAGGYFVALSYLTLAPDPWWIFGIWGSAAEETLEVSFDDFFQHGIAYTLLAVLLMISAVISRRPSLTTCGVIAVCHALLTESLQYWIPLRSFDVFDLLANVSGVVVGWGTTTLVLRALGPSAIVSEESASRVTVCAGTRSKRSVYPCGLSRE